MKRKFTAVCSAFSLLQVSALEAQEAATAPEPAPWHRRWGAWWSSEKAIQPFAVFTTEVWGNAAGGIKTGAWYNQLLDFGFEVDTGRLGWWEGGNFFVQAFWIQNAGNGTSFSDYTGAFNPVSGIAAGDAIRVYNLYYRHSWRDDSLQVKVGQIAADDDFMGSDYAALFLNSALGAMPSQVGTPLASRYGNCPEFPVYAVAAPGIFIRWNFITNAYTQLGVYYGKPGFDIPSNHGFDWASQSPPEAGLFWENGVSYSLAHLPATSRIGLNYHTGDVDHFKTSSGSTPAAARQSVPAFYAVQDLQLATHADGSPALGLFGRGGISPEPSLTVVHCYADAGFNWFGPFIARPDDIAGVAVSLTHFSSDFRRSSAGSGFPSDQTTVELTYRAQLAGRLALQADTQFLFDPITPAASGSDGTAIVLGMRAEFSF